MYRAWLTFGALLHCNNKELFKFFLYFSFMSLNHNAEEI